MLEELKSKWDEILNTVKFDGEISEVSFKTWIQPLTVHSIHGNVLTLIVPTEKIGRIGISIIKRKYEQVLMVTIAEAMGKEFELHFVLKEDLDKLDESSEEEDNTNNENQFSPDFSKRVQEANLNIKFNFDTFVVGPSNEFAQAAALAVAETPGEMHNPFFIYGGAGLGKTHLIQSIGIFILQHNPNAKVLYCSSESFTNELIEAIKTGTTTSFKNKYRSVDALIIDDIQFIVDKESAQMEFFNTFNALYMVGKQIIISSDKPPKDLYGLEERLRTRFESGGTIDIVAPDYVTRMAILRKKCEQENYHISNDILDYIASNIKSNIRSLEGALKKLDLYSRFSSTELTLDIAKETLKDTIYPDKNKTITPQVILETVADHFAISVTDLVSRKKDSKIAYPRQIYMYLCRTLTDESLASIGSLIKRKDHTTISYGIDKITKEIDSNQATKTTVEVIRKKLIPE